MTGLQLLRSLGPTFFISSIALDVSLLMAMFSINGRVGGGGGEGERGSL